MPAGDGTGPMGWGPMSGRAAGYCAGFAVPGYVNPGRGRALAGPVLAGYAPAAAPAGVYGYGRRYLPAVPLATARWGRGFGFGRGRGFGRGGARGWRRFAW